MRWKVFVRFEGGKIVLARKVLVKRLVEFDDKRDGLVEHVDKMRKRIAEETADAQRYVHARAAKLFKRSDGNPLQPTRLSVPDRLDAKQSERFCDIVAMSAHLGCTPHAQSHHLWITPL